eukprot:TRINITY_DN20_c3_g1_i1.p1 TRINITY_DN20_c3_g1~~TRINITY_DN20_c3_g1_i1.p1  ORF type:complete len:1301 (-),score=217.38 TRINITY_DN20_c3_g1_i1:156-4058(-)
MMTAPGFQPLGGVSYPTTGMNTVMVSTGGGAMNLLANMTPAAATPKKTGPVRKKVKHACYHCKMAHAACDPQRPCRRCDSLGMGDECHDPDPKKRSRKSTPVMERRIQQTLPEDQRPYRQQEKKVRVSATNGAATAAAVPTFPTPYSNIAYPGAMDLGSVYGSGIPQPQPQPLPAIDPSSSLTTSYPPVGRSLPTLSNTYRTQQHQAHQQQQQQQQQQSAGVFNSIPIVKPSGYFQPPEPKPKTKPNNTVYNPEPIVRYGQVPSGNTTPREDEEPGAGNVPMVLSGGSGNAYALPTKQTKLSAPLSGGKSRANKYPTPDIVLSRSSDGIPKSSYPTSLSDFGVDVNSATSGQAADSILKTILTELNQVKQSHAKLVEEHQALRQAWSANNGSNNNSNGVHSAHKPISGTKSSPVTLSPLTTQTSPFSSHSPSPGSSPPHYGHPGPLSGASPPSSPNRPSSPVFASPNTNPPPTNIFASSYAVSSSPFLTTPYADIYSTTTSAPSSTSVSPSTSPGYSHLVTHMHGGYAHPKGITYVPSTTLAPHTGYLSHPPSNTVSPSLTPLHSPQPSPMPSPKPSPTAGYARMTMQHATASPSKSTAPGFSELPFPPVPSAAETYLLEDSAMDIPYGATDNVYSSSTSPAKPSAPYWNTSAGLKPMYMPPGVTAYGYEDTASKSLASYNMTNNQTSAIVPAPAPQKTLRSTSRTQSKHRSRSKSPQRHSPQTRTQTSLPPQPLPQPETIDLVQNELSEFEAFIANASIELDDDILGPSTAVSNTAPLDTLILGTLAENKPYAMLNRSGNDMIFSQTNEAFSNLYGYASNELIGQSWRVIMPSCQYPVCAQMLQSYTKSPASNIASGEVVGITKNGTRFCTVSKHQFFYDDKGALSWTVVYVESWSDYKPDHKSTCTVPQTKPESTVLGPTGEIPYSWASDDATKSDKIISVDSMEEDEAKAIVSGVTATTNNDIASDLTNGVIVPAVPIRSPAVVTPTHKSSPRMLQRDSTDELIRRAHQKAEEASPTQGSRDSPANLSSSALEDYLRKNGHPIARVSSGNNSVFISPRTPVSYSIPSTPSQLSTSASALATYPISPSSSVYSIYSTPMPSPGFNPFQMPLFENGIPADDPTAAYFGSGLDSGMSTPLRNSRTGIMGMEEEEDLTTSLQTSTDIDDDGIAGANSVLLNSADAAARGSLALSGKRSAFDSLQDLLSCVPGQEGDKNKQKAHGSPSESKSATEQSHQSTANTATTAPPTPVTTPATPAIVSGGVSGVTSLRSSMTNGAGDDLDAMIKDFGDDDDNDSFLH